MHDLRKNLILLIILLAIAAIAALFSTTTLSIPKFFTVKSEPTLADKIRTGAAPIPEYTAATDAKLKASNGFDALVSYTDRGFEPRTVTIAVGESVRFTNNSSNLLWIASQGGNVQIYPRTRDVCGSTDLDSCEPFMPQDFWEFTFDSAGTWEVVNNLDKSKSGTVIVK